MSVVQEYHHSLCRPKYIKDIFQAHYGWTLLSWSLKGSKKKSFEIPVVQAAATRVTEKAVPNSGEFEITWCQKVGLHCNVKVNVHNNSSIITLLLAATLSPSWQQAQG